jgi:hypothetical protein
VKDEVAILLIIVSSAITGGILGQSVGAGSSESKIRHEAVQAGVARWVCDPSTGKTEFQWVKPEDK